MSETRTAQARDLASLWETYSTRWQAALAVPFPDADLLRLGGDEAHQLANLVIDNLSGPAPSPARDDAWEAVTTAGNLLDLYGRAAQLAGCCPAVVRLPETYRPLASSCREALTQAGRAVERLRAVLLTGGAEETDAEHAARFEAEEAERERLSRSSTDAGISW